MDREKLSLQHPSSITEISRLKGPPVVEAACPSLACPFSRILFSINVTVQRRDFHHCMFPQVPLGNPGWVSHGLHGISNNEAGTKISRKALVFCHVFLGSCLWEYRSNSVVRKQDLVVGLSIPTDPCLSGYKPLSWEPLFSNCRFSASTCTAPLLHLFGVPSSLDIQRS